MELPIIERITSNNYIDRLLTSYGNEPAHIEPRSYSTLGTDHISDQLSKPSVFVLNNISLIGFIGKGHLACLTYAGGRPILRRKNLASAEDYIRDDINVLSHYSRFRQAAEKAAHTPDTGTSCFLHCNFEFLIACCNVS